MSVALQIDVVETLRELLDACPVPARWHPGAAEIRQVFEDFRLAVETLEGHVTDCHLDVEAARARLDALPRPQGQHPYLDTIVPTLEAMEVALALLRPTGVR